MPTAYTSLLGLALPVTGELTGTWGDTVNDEITDLVDEAIAGTTTLAADADVTLTSTAGAPNQSRPAVLLWTAANAVSRNITAPPQSKVYVVIHAGGAGNIVLRGTGPTAGITIVSGEKCVAAWDGSDYVKLASSLIPSGTVLTLPQINDTSADHQYIFGVNELAANRTITLPLLTTNDVFVFAAFAQTLTNKTLTNPTITNYVETLFSANTSTAITLDLANGTVQNITSTGNATVTMPAAVAGKSFIMFRRSGTGSFTITWSTVRWPAGVAPTLTATASRMDVFSFFSDGTNWYGTVIALNYTP